MEGATAFISISSGSGGNIRQRFVVMAAGTKVDWTQLVDNRLVGCSAKHTVAVVIHGCTCACGGFH